jgi:ribonuclease HI
MNIVDQEEVDPPQDTTMLIWDPNLIMPSDNLFESQEPPVEVSVVQTRSKGPPVSKDITATQTLRDKTSPDHPKTPFSPSRKPISIHTRESPKLDYNVVEDLKKLRVNISVMDMCRIPQQKDFLLQALNSVEDPTTSNGQERNIASTDPVNKPTMNTCSEDKKGKPFVPPFLLTFEVFNRNLHNCLVDSGASSNVMPLSICKKLNVIPLQRDKHAYRLEFECTNNTIEYEALVQGLKKTIDLNVKKLKVFRDLEIIIRQVRNTIHCNSLHLKNYQQEVHRLMEHFEAFNITAIPREKNILVDSLATAASRLSPLEDYESSRFTVELLYKPSVPNKYL